LIFGAASRAGARERGGRKRVGVEVDIGGGGDAHRWAWEAIGRVRQVCQCSKKPFDIKGRLYSSLPIYQIDKQEKCSIRLPPPQSLQTLGPSCGPIQPGGRDKRRWGRPGERRLSALSTPNSTACRSAFQRATSGRVNNIGAHDRARASFRKFSIHSAKTATNGAGCLSSLFMADGLAGSGAWEGTDALAGTACRALRRIGAHRVRPRGSRAGTDAERALSASRPARHQRYALTGLPDNRP